MVPGFLEGSLLGLVEGFMLGFMEGSLSASAPP